jgi:hypothetical protein
MGKVNFGYILGWSVLSMLALNWLVNLLAGPAQARALRLVLLCVHSSLTAGAGPGAVPLRLAAWLQHAAHSALLRRRCFSARKARALARPIAAAFLLTQARAAHRGFTACLLGLLATTWSTHTASSLLTSIVPSLEVRCCSSARLACACSRAPQGQRMLVAYPCALVYGLFALLTLG